MSTSFYFKFALLISFLLFISISSICADSYQENTNEDNDILSMIRPKSSPIHHRFDRSSLFYPRANRNSWFRASTYQHMKPSTGPEEKNAGDHLMRWG
jgi:hypothetical protein